MRGGNRSGSSPDGTISRTRAVRAYCPWRKQPAAENIRTMTKARLDGLTMLALGCVFFVAIGVLMEHFNSLGMTDFEQIYTSSRCVAHHHDPYSAGDLRDFYLADTGSLPPASGPSARTRHEIVLVANNLPTTLFLIAPIAALPWKLAEPLWMLLIAASFILACFLIWSFGAESAPRAYGALLLLVLVNSGLLLCAGNTAGIVVSLSVIAACCFLKNRCSVAGVCALAIALLMKPHDAGPIWLYFLLAGGLYRRRALQTAVLAAMILAAALLWVSISAPHWWPELQSNLAAGFAPGGINNPGPTTQGGRGIGQIIALQSILSLIWDNAKFYNLAAGLLCAPLLLAWCVRTVRRGFSPWLALASISVLAMLPFYHRTYDARLLLLAIPACATPWTEGRAAGRTALALTLAAIVLTGDIFWVVYFQLTHYSGPSGVFAMFPAPIALLATGLFYLWVYVKAGAEEPKMAEESG